jgi:anti-sigma B factor antagonist
VPLSIDVDRRAGRPTFTLGGELDILTAPQLTRRFVNAIDRRAGDVVLDVERLEFCDSSGLAALVRLAQHLDSGTVTIAGPRPIVRRLLEVSGMVDVFVVTDGAPTDGAAQRATTLSPA